MIGTGLDSKNIAQTDFETWKRFSHRDVLDLINGFVLVSAKFDEWEKALEGTAEKYSIQKMRM